VAVPRGSVSAAVGLSLFAALLWAAYYIFVLGVTPGTRPSAVFVYPFLFGGVAYTAWSIRGGHGAALARLWRDPMSYVRVALLLSMQLAVLASTYLAGPVDTSLLSLIGDVVLTPILVAGWLLGYRSRFSSPVLLVGMGLCLVGGGLAIAGGHGLTALSGWGYVVLVVIPVSVALYFLACARENERSPPSAVVSQSMLAAALIALAISPLLPGGLPGLRVTDPVALLILLATGLTSFFIAPALYFDAIRRAGYVVPPMLMTGIPVFAGILGWVVLGIAIPPIGIIGIPIAVVGALVALRGETETPEPRPSASGGS
jgi:drug/metabolite transporter (DMT)-like permease